MVYWIMAFAGSPLVLRSVEEGISHERGISVPCGVPSPLPRYAPSAARAACAPVSRFGRRVSGFRLRLSGFECRLSGFRLRVSVVGFQVSGFEFRVSGVGFEVSGIRISGSGFRDKYAGCRFRLSC